ncbi:ribonucleotide-diphosphate reductase subunit beta [bacterium]|nr:ribonucleotide-diphosphate reductase subunit beta [bacterium]
MKSVLNLKNVDTTKQPLFLGEDLNLQRYDRFKYPVFFELFKKQNENFWWPHEITLAKDRSDYKDLTETERFVFDSNLRFQTLGDSMLSRSIHSLKEYVSNPELEICMNTWAQFEGIHSYSYSYLLNNVYPDATKFFDSIMEDKEILERAELIRNNYDKILGDDDKKDIKQKIFDCILSVNVMEGLVFYVSFACSFYFGYRGKMEGNAKIIKFIQRDEALHFSTTQNLLKILATEEKEGFVSIVKKNEDKIYEIYKQATENETEWAKYLFSKGNLLGLNEEVMTGYTKWLCDNRLRSLGYKKIYNQKENPISGWLDSYMDSSKVQVAPQETEISTYKIGARDTSISDDDFADIKL